MQRLNHPELLQLQIPHLVLSSHTNKRPRIEGAGLRERLGVATAPAEDLSPGPSTHKDSSQLPVSAAQSDLTPSIGLGGHLHSYLQTYTHNIIKK